VTVQTAGPRRMRLHLPFARLALCVDCEECFEIDALRCPACGSKSIASLARFLGRSSGRSSEAKGVRHLVIVARNQTSLYDYLTAAFAGNTTVAVALDRRTVERRRRTAPVIAERRRGDRRRDGQVLERLRTLGWAVIEVR
jgi:hypothetical protein